MTAGLQRRADSLLAAHGRRRAIRDGLWVAGLIYLAFFTANTIINGPAYDARAYYDARLDSLYARPDAGSYNAFYYSPVFAQVLAPLTVLPWPVFLAVWMTFAAAALAYLAGPLLVFVLAFPPVVIELQVGNIHFLLGLAVALAIRHPGTWALPILTKVTPGIGILWFAVRRQWRGLLVALGSTGAIVAVSFALAPPLWFDWLESLRVNSGTSYEWPLLPVPLVVRMALAAALIAWGAHTDRRWTVPLGATMALPLLWPANWAMIVGVLPDVRRALARRFGSR
jgi:Glycosyltransferase family 87